MAKNKNIHSQEVHVLKAGEIGFVPVGQLATVWELEDRLTANGSYHVHQFNTTRGKKLEPDLINRTTQLLALHPEGWDTGFNAQVMVDLPKDCPFDITFDEVVEARKRLYAKIEERCDLQDQSALVQREVFRKTLLDDVGNFIVPTYWVNAGITRCSVIREANNVRAGYQKSLITQIPVEVRHFSTEEARVLANIRENTISKTGDNKIGERGLWLVAEELYKLGWTQSDFRFASDTEKKRVKKGSDESKLFGGKGQAYFHMLELNADFPSAKTIERFKKAKDDNDALDFKKFSLDETNALYAKRTTMKIGEYMTEIERISKGENGDAKPKKASWDAIDGIGRVDNLFSRKLLGKLAVNEVDGARVLATSIGDVCNVAMLELETGNYSRFKEFVLEYDLALKGGYLPALMAAIESAKATTSAK